MLDPFRTALTDPCRRFRARLAAAVLAVAGALPGAAAAADSAASAWVETEQTRVRLVAAQHALSDSREVSLGLQFELLPHWKIYWRSPGDAGFPPHVDWAGSRNLAAADLRWPAPERFEVVGLQTLGYEKEVVLPFAAKAVTASQAVDLQARVRYLACNDICIPYEANLSLSVPPGAARPSPHAHLIGKYLASVPGDGAAHGLRLADLRSVTAGKTAHLQLTARADAPFAAPDVFVEGAPGLAFGPPKVTLSKDGREALMDVAVDGLDGLDDAKGKTLDGRSFVVTLVDGGRAAERELTAQPG
ncbi:MAG: protein-disulfide reductase DsbD domain-containing protein, partial [Rhodospirillaceae bacterium]